MEAAYGVKNGYLNMNMLSHKGIFFMARAENFPGLPGQDRDLPGLIL